MLKEKYLSNGFLWNNSAGAVKIRLMNKETMYFRTIMKSLFVLSLIVIAISGCSSHKSMIASDVVIYDNDSVTTQAEFPGGAKEFRAFKKHIHTTKYRSSRERQIAEGVGIYTFIIDEKGNVKDIKVLQSVSANSDLSVVRLLKKMPKWKPATLNGTPVCVRVKSFWNFNHFPQRYDVAPYFPGGIEALEPLLIGYEEGERGVVYVSCIIDEEGNVKDPEVVSGLSFHADRQALGLVRSLPKWKPAMKNGKPIRAKRSLAVYFPQY